VSEQGNSSSEENPKTNRPENEDEEKFIIKNLDHEDDQEISGEQKYWQEHYDDEEDNMGPRKRKKPKEKGEFGDRERE